MWGLTKSNFMYHADLAGDVRGFRLLCTTMALEVLILCVVLTDMWHVVFFSMCAVQIWRRSRATLTLSAMERPLMLVVALVSGAVWAAVYSLTLGLQFTHLLLVCSLLTYSWSAVDSLTLGLQLTHLLLVCSWLIYLLFNARSGKIAQWYSTPVRHLWS